jgi:NAD(P)-dependent dehydrogenase (short-subunit alcohol dehydrogenase family)
MTGCFAQRHVLITGAGSGIGAAIARGFAAGGAKVSLAGRNSEPLSALAASLALCQVVSGFDVTDSGAIEAGVMTARGTFGPIDILVNNAGAVQSGPFGKISLAAWNEALAVNLTGSFSVTQAVLADLQEADAGRVINIASTAGLKAYPYVCAYVAAKHGLIGLTRSLALELARTAVTVNAVCPGYTDTPLLARAVATIAGQTGRSPDAARERLAAANPQNRLITPDEVADVVLWLARKEAGSITGQAIAVAGGEVMAG